MKSAFSSMRLLAATALALTCSGLLLADPIRGPKGGRVVTTDAPHVEFFVTPDHRAVVTFYDGDFKPMPVGDRVVSAIAETKAGKTTLSFVAEDGALVSATALPPGDGYRVVLQVRETPQARPQNHRLEFEQAVCDECKLAEYACICTH